MRAADVAARLTARGIQQYDGAGGRSTRPFENLAAYLGRVSPEAMLYATIVYFGEATDRNVYRLYLNVLLRVCEGWEPIGAKPKTAAAMAGWKARNAHLIERLTRMAVQEAINPAAGNPNKAQWRASQLELTERRWHQAYRSRYDKITAVLGDWDGEFCGKVVANQIDLEVEP